MATVRRLLPKAPLEAKLQAEENGAGAVSLQSRRRYVVAVAIGMAVSAIPYSWVLVDLWRNSPSLFRTADLDGYASNFYDLQARAMFHGHLYVANGALGAEAFVHD